MSNYLKCNWANFNLDTPPTNNFVIENGTLLYTGVGGSSANYGEHYILADAPCKLVWNIHGANKSIYIISEDNGVNIYHANIQNANNNLANLYGTTAQKGATLQEWYYGGLDGYCATVTYKFANYHSGSYPNDWTDIEGTGIPSFYREDGRAHGQAEGYCDDDDWNWNPVNYVEPTPDPEPTEPDPEPVDDPVTTSGIMVRVTCSADNPYEGGGDSGIGGGGGGFENPLDVINGEPLPTVGVTDSMFIKLWNPNANELRDLANYLFTEDFWTQTQRAILGSPMDCLISVGVIPVALHTEANKSNFQMGGTASNISMYRVTQQYEEVDCGQAVVTEYWKSFLDYEPYTKLQIYLPFIGYRDISPSEVLNKMIHVYYHIDVFSGACVAFIECGNSILYQFNGNCLMQIPFGANEHASMVSGFIGTIGGIASMAIGMGAAGGLPAALAAGMTIGGASGAASSLISGARETFSHGGNIGGAVGFMSLKKPYFIINRPQQAVARDQNAFSGYATWYSSNDFIFTQGYTKVAQIHLENIPATDWEVQEIERLLKEGVIF